MKQILKSLARAFGTQLYRNPEENASTGPQWESYCRQLHGTWRTADHHQPVPRAPEIAEFWDGRAHAFVASVGAQAEAFVELAQPDFNRWWAHLLRWLASETVGPSHLLSIAGEDGDVHLALADQGHHLEAGGRVWRRLVQLTPLELEELRAGRAQLGEVSREARVVDLRRVCSKSELKKRKQGFATRLRLLTARYERLRSQGAPAVMVENERQQMEEVAQFLATLEPIP